ncbi:hypothetical protein [Fimbriiglobus ruber]|uniref:Uncharacterized protein n=1 Tax=Fimbriiglobus ruber TaxID=1908690 RepID=A0A225DLN0_9BACT|nr:hypothetical protein [Fimbriiglobus ruber]OWK42370.1 hypothetical protein FRUB_04448 [Fimbriiglobus ruber]
MTIDAYVKRLVAAAAKSLGGSDAFQNYISEECSRMGFEDTVIPLIEEIGGRVDKVQDISVVFTLRANFREFTCFVGSIGTQVQLTVFSNVFFPGEPPYPVQEALQDHAQAVISRFIMGFLQSDSVAVIQTKCFVSLRQLDAQLLNMGMRHMIEYIDSFDSALVNAGYRRE